jgi:hypothetical protein
LVEGESGCVALSAGPGSSTAALIHSAFVHNHLVLSKQKRSPVIAGIARDRREPISIAKIAGIANIDSWGNPQRPGDLLIGSPVGSLSTEYTGIADIAAPHKLKAKANG